MSDFPFDHDSGKAMNRHRSNAKAEAGLERRKLREEIERLWGRVARLEGTLQEALRDATCRISTPHSVFYHALNESPRQSVAEIEARALERVAYGIGDHAITAKKLREEANRIREQAKEKSDE